MPITSVPITRVPITRVSIARMPAVLAAVALLAACGGGERTTGVSGGSVLDANAINASATKLQAIATQPVLAAVAAEQGSLVGAGSFDRSIARLPQLISHGVAGAGRLAPPVRLGAARGDALAQTTVASPHIANITVAQLIPDSLLGKTLVPNVFGQYGVSAGTTGAPTNGVRLVIRAPGATQDLGYADVTQSISGSTSTVTLDVTATGGHVVLHDVETTTTTNGTDGTDGFVGYATNGTDRVDYTEVEQTTGARTVALTTLSAPSANVAIADTSIVAGMTATDVDVTRVTVGSALIRFTTNAVALPTPGTYGPSDTTSMAANGAPFARIVGTGGGTPSVTAPDGSPLSSADQAAITAVEGVLVFAGTVLLTPIAIAFWLSLL
jgi:hypothetical protein